MPSAHEGQAKTSRETGSILELVSVWDRCQRLENQVLVESIVDLLSDCLIGSFGYLTPDSSFFLSLMACKDACMEMCICESLRLSSPIVFLCVCVSAIV